jgi:hypothetical protein
MYRQALRVVALRNLAIFGLGLLATLAGFALVSWLVMR